MGKIERRVLIDVPTDLTGLLEAVRDPEARLKLLSKKQNTTDFTAAYLKCARSLI